MGEPAKGTFFDSIDLQWTNVIVEIFEKVAMGAPLWVVAIIATKMKLPKTKNAQKPEWAERNIKTMIRCTRYRGFDRHRVSQIRRMLSTGLTRSAESDDIWERLMP